MIAGNYIATKILCFALGFILMQGTTGTELEDPFTRATTPPSNFYMFNEDFASRDLARFFNWFSPEYGVVTNGILLTKDEAEEQFRQLFSGQGSNSLLEIDFYFNYGVFTGANTYMADCWLEAKLREDSGDNWYRMHHQLVFKITPAGWYLVQWEYIPPDINLPLDFQSLLMNNENVPEQFRDYVPLYRGSNTALEGVDAWPLLIGSNFADENSTQSIEGKMTGGSTWTLTEAVRERKPTVFYFFSVQAYSMYLPEDLEAEMDFLSGLYETFGDADNTLGNEDLYIFGVTDSTIETVEWMGEAGYNKFAILLDEGSMIHATMNITEYPFVVVLDAEGTVVALCKTFRPASLGIVEDQISDAISAASSDN